MRWIFHAAATCVAPRPHIKHIQKKRTVSKKKLYKIETECLLEDQVKNQEQNHHLHLVCRNLNL